MLGPFAAGRIAFALGAAALVAVEASEDRTHVHAGDGFEVELPAAWQPTLSVACARPDRGCIPEARFARADGAWLRVVVDPPGIPTADQLLDARLRGDGRVVPGALDPTAPRRVVGLTARAAGREYVLLAGSGGPGDLPPPDVDAAVRGLRIR
jgi:hypothetical protein